MTDNNAIANPYEFISADRFTINNRKAVITKQMKDIVRYLSSGPLELSGYRGSGKTAMLKGIEYLLKEQGRIPIYVNLNLDFNFGLKESNFLDYKFHGEFFKLLYNKTAYVKKEESAVIESQPDLSFYEKFRLLLEGINKAHQTELLEEKVRNQAVILLIDSAEKIYSIHPNIQNNLRGMLQAGEVTAIMAGIFKDIPLEITAGSPLYNMFMREPIGLLDKEEALQIINEPLKDTGISFAANAIEDILTKISAYDLKYNEDIKRIKEINQHWYIINSERIRMLGNPEETTGLLKIEEERTAIKDSLENYTIYGYIPKDLTMLCHFAFEEKNNPVISIENIQNAYETLISPKNQYYNRQWNSFQQLQKSAFYKIVLGKSTINSLDNKERRSLDIAGLISTDRNQLYISKMFAAWIKNNESYCRDSCKE